MILSVIARKGGVGKTTTAISLAAGLAAEGRRALVVDLDSQGNVGLSLGLEVGRLAPSMTDVLLDGGPMAESVRSTDYPGLAFATCDHRFRDAAARIGRLAAAERATLVRAALGEVATEFDDVILDTAGLDLVTVNALAASDGYIVLLQPEKLSMDGLRQVSSELVSISAEYGTRAALLGVLFTMVDPRIVAMREVIEEVRRHMGEDVFTTEIPRTTRIAEAPWKGEPVQTAFPASTGAAAYSAFAREVLQRARRKGVD